MSPTQLMERYCNGDPSAFRELYAMTAPRLLGYLRSLLRDAASAEEVLQQAFLKLHGARTAYVRGADPVPWLYAIAHRTCIDEMRRRRRSRVRLVAGDGCSLPEVEAALGGGAVVANDAEPYNDAERSAVLAALADLPPEQRAALALTKIQGLTMSDAARTLGTTEGAVKLRAHRAYARLRELLSRDEMFSERVQAAVARSQRSRERRRCSVR